MDRRNDFNFSGIFSGLYDFREKGRSQANYIMYMLNRTSRIFEYEGLPDTMPKRFVELYLQYNGHICVAENDGDLYAFVGGFSGLPDAYYVPTQYVVANPYLNLNKVFTIGEDCIVVPNDTMYIGLMPMFKRYATLMVENDLTMKIYDINARTSVLIDAPDDMTKDSALRYLENIEDGKLGVIGSNGFFDGVKTQPYSYSGRQGITELIEYQQYLKASWFNEIGLNANYNMKRESINSEEAQLNDDALLPLIDDMYENRVDFFDKVNELFGTNIKVRLSSAWEDNRIELAAEQKSLSDESEKEPEDEPEDVSEDEPEDVSEDEPEDVSEDEPEDVSEGEPEDVSEGEPEDVSEDEPEDEPEDVSEDEPEGEPEDVSEDEPEGEPEGEEIEDVLEGIEDNLERIAEALEGGEDDEEIKD